MKVIFLDVDGVLYSNEYIVERTHAIGRKLHLDERLDDDCINILKQLVDITGAKIVVTSSWKISDLDILTYRLKQHGVEIYDVTKNYGDERGREIREWLSKTQVSKYVIIDDDIFKDFDDEQLQYLVQPSMYHGRALNETHIAQVLNILGEDE